MAKSKGKKGSGRGPTRPVQIRLHESLYDQLEALAEKNLTNITVEIRAAIRDRLAANGLWPVPPTQSGP